MFYEIELKSHIRVPPNLFDLNTEEAVLKQLNEQFEGYISKDIGIVIAVSGIVNVSEGIIIPGDGAAYYNTIFKLFTYKPEVQEIMLGKISDVTDFGAFIDIGSIDGMVHISQTMDDFVSYNKSNVLTGKESKKVLKINDLCRARIIAVSYKDINNPKIGLTMRQVGLGKEEWLEESKKKEDKKENEKKGMQKV